MDTTKLELKLCEIRHDIFHNEEIPTKECIELRKQLNEAIALVKNLSIHDVVVQKGTLCDVCGSENTITVSHKGENCDWCNPL